MPEGTMIDRYLHARARAEKIGDAGVIRECDLQLRLLGYRADVPATIDAAAERAEAAAKPRRGRPRTRRTAE